MRPYVISHAACAGHAPENSLAGVRAALELGADAIEVDVQCSADGIPVLMHDLALDRTTSGSGDLAKLTLPELRNLDAGGEPVPTLQETIALTRGNALLIAEIKRPGCEEAIARLARNMDALDAIMVWSFLPQALEAIRAAEPRIPAALLLAPQNVPEWPVMRDMALRLGLQGVSIFHQSLDGELLASALRAGLTTYAWTADAEDDIQRLLDVGVDGIVTNYPDRALALRGRAATTA